MHCPRCSVELAPEATTCAVCGASDGEDTAGPVDGEDTRQEAPEVLLGTAQGFGALQGETIRGYTVGVPLASGGTSTVWRARGPDGEVAIKVLEAGPSDAEAIRRFEREARALRALDHPNIVPVHDFFVHDGCVCLVMDFLPGGSLQRFLGGAGTLSEKRALSVGRQVGRGLAAAARAGVVHRDIKPANLLLGDYGEVRIADFGIAKMPAEGRTQLTGVGDTIGTPSYMPPEQWSDCRAVDTRSDLYALGCALYHLLTGQTPYPGRRVFDQLQGHSLAPVPDIRVLRPELSEGFAAVIARLMAKEPDGRFPTGDALADELARLRSRLSGVAEE